MQQKVKWAVTRELQQSLEQQKLYRLNLDTPAVTKAKT